MAGGDQEHSFLAGFRASAIWGLLLALKRRVHGVFLFASLLAFYPLVYYICFPEPRYRHPIDPELLILGVYLVSQAQTRSHGA